MHIFAPKSHAARVQASSYVWWSGRHDTSTSSALKSTVAHALETTEKTFFWLSITIFDEPVVPEVNRISAILSLSLSGVKNLVLFLPDATILS